MAVFELVSLLALLFVLFKIYRKIKKSAYHLPPGPRGLPILGNNLQIAKNAPLQLSKWAKEYGKLYTIRIGNNLPALVVSDVALMKQLFGSMASTGKFQSEIMDKLFDGSHGISNAEGRVWQEQREFMVKTFKRTFDLRMGKLLETTILSHVELLEEWMEKEMSAKGEVVLSEMLTKSSGSTVWSMITGEGMEDAGAILVENWIKTMQKVAKSGLAFFSWIKYIAPEWSGYRAYVKAVEDLHKFVKRCFEEHALRIAEGNADGGGDVVTAYIEHMEKMKDNSDSSFFGVDGYQHSVQSVNALILAGTETTASSIHWLLFYLIVHPDVQQKVQQEIEERIGTDREPMLTDRKLMPYVEAVILETFRLSSLVPFGAIHRLMEDMNFGEYKLPKNLLLLPNMYHIHHDQEIWGDPESFRPERFLENMGTDGQRQLNNLKEFVAPFQVGRRMCIGEALSKDVVFLFVAKLLQKLNFYPSPATDKEMYMKPEIGYFLTPRDIGIKISKRN